MQALLQKNLEFQTHLSTLEEYIKFNKVSPEAKYREYQDIIYGAIINRGYTLWETFVKELFYLYFELRKNEYLSSKTIIEKYRLNELPGFLFDLGILDIEKNTISFELNEHIVSYTSGNIEMKELSKLFKRVDIDISPELNKSKDLKQAVSNFELAFEDGLLDGNATTQALKRLIQERNLVSHYAHLDNFQSIDILLEWIKFYKVLGKVLSKIIVLEYINTLENEYYIIGECKTVLKKKILIIDTFQDAIINKESLIYVYSNSKLIDVVTPTSFRIKDNEVDEVIGINPVGIEVQTIFDNETKLKKEFEYKLKCLVVEKK